MKTLEISDSILAPSDEAAASGGVTQSGDLLEFEPKETQHIRILGECANAASVFMLAPAMPDGAIFGSIFSAVRGNAERLIRNKN